MAAGRISRGSGAISPHHSPESCRECIRVHSGPHREPGLNTVAEYVRRLVVTDITRKTPSFQELNLAFPPATIARSIRSIALFPQKQCGVKFTRKRNRMGRFRRNFSSPKQSMPSGPWMVSQPPPPLPPTSLLNPQHHTDIHILPQSVSSIASCLLTSWAWTSTNERAAKNQSTRSCTACSSFSGPTTCQGSGVKPVRKILTMLDMSATASVAGK